MLCDRRIAKQVDAKGALVKNGKRVVIVTGNERELKLKSYKTAYCKGALVPTWYRNRNYDMALKLVCSACKTNSRRLAELPSTEDYDNQEIIIALINRIP